VATTALELLSAVSDTADSSGVVDAALADDAVRAMHHLGRALHDIAGNPGSQEPRHLRRRLVTTELAKASQRAAGQWATGSGRLSDLAGVAADAIGNRASRLDPDESWAAAIELGSATGRCVEIAARFVPYSTVPALASVSRLGALLDQLARADPARAGTGAWLERPVATSTPALPQTPGAGAADLLASLATSLDRELRAGTLQIYPLLAACAAAEICAEHVQNLAAALTPRAQVDRTSTPAAHAWRVLQGALVRFDDGSRFVSRAPSSITASALAVQRHVEAFAGAPFDRRPSRDNVTDGSGVANQLPDLARVVGEAVEKWAGTGRLFARARSLPSSEEHVLAVIQGETVVVTPRDVGPVLMSARATARLSAALAIEMDRSATRLGHRPQSHVIAALEGLARPDLRARDTRWANNLATRCNTRSPITPVR
jgi:hypothetical protein